MLFSDASYKLQSYSLSVKHMEKDSKAATIETTVRSSFTKYNIDIDDVVYCATDGGSNVVKASRDMFGEEARVICMCHLLSLILDAVHRRYPDNKKFITEVKDIVQFCKRSHVATELLKHYQRVGGEKVIRTVIQSVCTRWNSELCCLRRYILLHKYVLQMLNDPSMATARSPPQPLSEATVKVIQELVLLLTPFETLTKLFSGSSYSAAGLVVSRLIEAHGDIVRLNIQEESPKEFQRILAEELDIKIQKIKKNLSYACAELLDPRYFNLFIFVTCFINNHCNI